MQNDSESSSGQTSIERRLATILMADVFGYSKMMGENEEQTVRVFRGHRAVFDELLHAHRGRIFNTAGDAILAEFPSAVEAVRCATEIQTALRTRNEHLPEEQRMWFRIGINLGDVIVQGGDLLGDGVNVAARIQTIAEPGGVCISGSVYDQIQNKLTLQIKQLGEKSFKNIAQPVRTFSISDDGGGTKGVRWRPSRKAPIALTLGLAAAFIAAGGAGYWIYRDHDLRVAQEIRLAQEAQRAAEVQRKAEQDKAAAAAEKEAKLQAELQSAKSALAQAEASKRKAEADRAAAEMAQREVRVQADLKAAKDALQKANESEKKAEQDRLAAAAAMKTAEAATAMKSTEAAARKASGTDRQAARAGREAGAAQKGEADMKSATSIATATTGASGTGAAKGVDRFNGTYAGRMCSINSDGSPRCWPVSITAQHGALSATWTGRNNLPSNATGTITEDGSVKLALSGYSYLKGNALMADVHGTVVDNKLTFSGNWNNGSPISGTWVLNR